MIENAVIAKDCVKGMAELSAGSVDLVFADPPFNIGHSYDIYDDRKSTDEYLAWTKEWGKSVSQVLKPTGSFWLAIGDEYAAELKCLFHRELGFHLRDWVIWYYTFGVNCTKKFSRSHTHLFHFTKHAKKFTFNDKDIRVPSARQLVYNDKRANAKGRLPDNTWILRPQDLEEGFTKGEDTWHVPRVCGTFKERQGFHGCQMPEEVMERIIKVSSSPGELVLDPFVGSGTTVVVAKRLGRKYLGFDISEQYVEHVNARLAAVNFNEGTDK